MLRPHGILHAVKTVEYVLTVSPSATTHLNLSEVITMNDKHRQAIFNFPWLSTIIAVDEHAARKANYYYRLAAVYFAGPWGANNGLKPIST